MKWGKFSFFLFFAGLNLLCPIAYPFNDTPLPHFPILMFDSTEKTKLPKHFRTCQTPFPSFTLSSPSRFGLELLQASGSGEFTQENFINLKKTLNKSNVIVVDLRREPHAFLDGVPIKEYDMPLKYKNSYRPKLKEQKLINNLNLAKQTIVYQKTYEDEDEIFNPELISYFKAYTEQQFVSKFKFGYQRLYVASDSPPDLKEIDKFITFVKHLRPNTWLHFHCDEGLERTTTFLVLYDILKNAKHVKLDDIVKRQAIIGGIHVLHYYNQANWQVKLNKKQLHFITAFYQYVIDPDGLNSKSFSSWLAKSA